MLSIDDPGKGHTSSAYYWDYYNLECVEAAEWFGTGAEIFGLRGEPDRLSFHNFRMGRAPDGTFDLVKNAGHPHRDTHWDLTFSAPKSASVLYALGSDEVRRQIVEAHKFAVRMALKYMEEHAAITRHGKGGVIRERCATVGSFFTHDASREHDMQLHSHCILMNVGIRADGGTGALHSVEIFRHKMEMGRVYQDAFAYELTKRLGVAIEKEKVGFHIQGVPKELCRENSTRRQQIEAEMKAQGLEGAAAAKKVAEDTRVTKRVMEKEALFDKWQKTCEAFGWGQKEAAQLIAEASMQKQKFNEKGQRHSAPEKKAEPSRAEEKRENRAETEKQKTESSHSEGKQEGRTETKEQKTEQAKSQEQNKSQERKKDHAGGKEKKKRDAEKQKQKIEKEKIKCFTRDLRKAIDRIYVENRTVERVMKVANRLARVHGVKSEDVLKAVKDAKLPKHLGWGRIEYRKLFPKAHRLNPFSDLKLPVLALRDPARKWGKIDKKVVLLKIPYVVQHEFRVQQRYLFPGAPKWNPVHKLSFPALRFVVKKAESEAKSKPKENINNKAQEHWHEQ